MAFTELFSYNNRYFRILNGFFKKFRFSAVCNTFPVIHNRKFKKKWFPNVSKIISAPSCINSYTLPYLAYSEYDTSIPGTPRPSRRRHVHPGDATSIPATPRPSQRRHLFWRQCRPSVDAADPLTTVQTLCRHRHVSPVLGTSLPTSARLSCPRHVS